MRLDGDFIRFTMSGMLSSSIFKEKIHPGAVSVCDKLHKAGYQAFIVGGCVRDLLLGLIPKDWDITTDATPEQVMKVFPKTIPTGLQHGTITVCMGEGIDNHFEITTFRVEGEYTDGRRPEEVKFVVNVEQDLARRDLTINAMAYDIEKCLLIDPYAGIKDIQDGIIRAVGDANTRFQEDGLRIMRAARFAAQFNYSMEPFTFQAMMDNLETFFKVSKERISDELCKILMSPHPERGLCFLHNCGALDIACPLLSKSSPILGRQGECLGELETRLAFMYHKLPTKLVEQELTELKLSTKEIKRVVFLLLTKISFLGFQQSRSVTSYRRFVARIKNKSPDAWEHTFGQFIKLATALNMPIELLERYRGTQVPSRKELAINGNDLIAMGIVPGDNIKLFLDSSYDEILEHPEHNDKDYLLGLIKKRM